MKTIVRLNKNIVLSEVKALRHKMKTYFAMSLSELVKELKTCFPSDEAKLPSREYILECLLMAATYHMTNVLAVE